MAIKAVVYVECDECGEPSGHDETGLPAPELQDTEAEAIGDAVENCGWVRAAGGRLLCRICAETAEAAAESEAGIRPPTWEEQVVAAVGEMLRPASIVTGCEAFGALVFRLREHHERTGRSPAETLRALPERDLEFAIDGAAVPAAFLARKVSEL